MAGSLAGITLRLAILSGTMTGAQLETYLATPAQKSVFEVLNSFRGTARLFMQSPTAMATFEDSATARTVLYNSTVFKDALKTSGQGLYQVITRPNLHATFYPALVGFAAGGNSKLKCVHFEASTTWNLPPTGVLAIAVAAMGAGANGNTGNTGGGAGETRATGTLTTGLPTGPVAVTVPAAGSEGSASFGSYLTALGATTQTGATSGAAIGNIAVDYPERNLSVLPWAKTALRKAGADGGGNVAGSPGGGTNPGLAATGATSWGGGGAGAGESFYTNSSTGGTAGANSDTGTGGPGGASPNGGGGGGSFRSGGGSGGVGGNGGKFAAGGGGTNTMATGTGGQGLVVLWYIEG